MESESVLDQAQINTETSDRRTIVGEKRLGASGPSLEKAPRFLKRTRIDDSATRCKMRRPLRGFTAKMFPTKVEGIGFRPFPRLTEL